MFAGVTTTYLSISFPLSNLGNSRYWCDRVRAEIDAVVDQYAHSRYMPLTNPLNAVLMKAWDTEFPLLECCLRETIRLSSSMGCLYHRDIGTRDVKVGNKLFHVLHWWCVFITCPEAVLERDMLALACELSYSVFCLLSKHLL